MLKKSITVILLTITLFATGCTPDIAYRHSPSFGSWEKCPAEHCEGVSSVELKSYTQSKDNPSSGEYLLGFVEFDDQGWFQNPEQKNNLFKAMNNYSDGRKTPLLIVVYAHGWKHNADKSDPDIQKFGELLKDLDSHEQKEFKKRQDNEKKQPLPRFSFTDKPHKDKARKVIGVYLGWRGDSISLEPFRELSFWERKNAGERVGERSAKQLLMELNQFRTYLNGWGEGDRLADNTDTQLVLIGHSFGGMLMYHAIHSQLMERALKVEPVDNKKKDDYKYSIAKSFGDFVLLVNPAFEGAEYEALFNIAKSRCYTSKQKPALAIITSEGDTATKWAFPFGRFYTLLQSAPRKDERETVFNTVGHLDRYITHKLSYQPTSDTKNEDIDNTFGDTKLEKVSMTPTNFPYLVISADTEIISDHSDIWNDRFQEFVVEFISRKIVQRKSIPKEAKEKEDATCRGPFGLRK